MARVFVNEISFALKELIEKSVNCTKNGVVIYPHLFNSKEDIDDDYIILYGAVPQKELSKEQVPAIIFREYDIRFAHDRVDMSKQYELKDKNTGIEIQQGEPVYLYFQIDFFADYKTQIIEMEASWREKVLWNSALYVPSIDNTVNMTLVDYQILDQANSERYFRRTFSYKIWGRMGEVVKEVPMITSPVNIKM